MKITKPLGTTLGAVVLTVVAGGSALAVNAGVLREPPAPAVGTLDPAATVATDLESQPNIRYVVIYDDDPMLARLAPGFAADAGASRTRSPAIVQSSSATPTAANPGSDDGQFEDDHFEDDHYEGADDDD